MRLRMAPWSPGFSLRGLSWTCLAALAGSACNCGETRLRRFSEEVTPAVPVALPEPEPYVVRGIFDAGLREADAGPTDAGAPELPAIDAGPIDAGTVEDAGPPDAGPRDSGPLDAGAVEDAGPPDAGIDDGRPEDAGVHTPGVGCADGTREGFLSLADYPFIAGCAGAWSIGGVTRSTMTATCGRIGGNTAPAGNTSPNVEGNGCSAVDLCAEGWHLCRGRAEVAKYSPAGCADAVPVGTPNNRLFFAVAQHSSANSVCLGAGAGSTPAVDAGTIDNDVFGCGNLGATLSADKNCWPLNRALASMHADKCDYNEAEPSNGPWLCKGGPDSHLHEGALVTKIGCPARSCQTDGQSVGNSDKGGVLCCAD